MSKKQRKMTPAKVADQLAKFIAKQEETLKRYPVGPLANTARKNLQRGMNAMNELRKTNEQMRVQKDPQAQQMQQPVAQMNLGGSPTGVADSSFGITEAQQAMVDTLATQYGMSPAVAAAVASVTQKESGGSGTRVEMDYSNTSNARIRTVNSNFQRKFKDMSDEDLTALKADPEKFFNYVYGDLDTNSEEGDGYKYRGRGLVQVTGRDNYARVSKAIYGDEKVLLENPDLLLDDSVAGAAAAYFTAESGKGVEGYVDFDLNTPNPSPEQIQQVLNGTYAVVASGGTVSKSMAQDPERMAANYNQYSSAMPKMQEFAQQAVPSVSASQSAALPQEQQPVGGEAVAQPALAPTAMNPSGGDLNYHNAAQVGDAQVVPGTNILYAQNEHGDYNVIMPDNNRRAAFSIESGMKAGDGSMGFFGGKYVIRAEDFDGPESIQTAIRSNRSIPYVERVDGQMTDGDKSNFLALPITDPTSFKMQQTEDAAAVANAYGMKSGMEMGMSEVIDLVAEQRGIQPIKKDSKRMMGDMGKSYTYTVNNPQDEQRYNAEMNAIRAEVASNPGSYVFTKDGEQHVGVGGYSPFSDYVSYKRQDPEFQTSWQNRSQTWGLGGQFAMPGGYIASARQAAVMRGSTALGTGLGDDAIRAIERGDDIAQIAAADVPKALPKGTLALPPASPKAGPAVKGVKGMKFKPGTGAAGEPVTYIPANNAAGKATQLAPKTAAGVNPGQQAAASVLDDAAAAGVPAKGVAKPGDLLPVAQRGNVSIMRPTQGTNALTLQGQQGQKGLQLVPNQGLAAQRAALADDSMTFGQYMKNAGKNMLSGQSGINMANMTGAAMQGAMAYDPQYDPRVLQQEQGMIPEMAQDVIDTPEQGTGTGEGSDKGAGPDKSIEQPVAGSETPLSDIEAGDADKYNINMPNMSPLMAVPALASLASVGIQRRALDNMQGPRRPITNEIPAFEYRSNVGQQLQDLTESTRAAGTGTNLQGSQQAALRTQLGAQQGKQQARILQQDALMRQNAKNQYDRLAFAAQSMNNTLRNKYLEDSTNFDNQKEMLEAQVRQQPLNVLSSTAQDYLKNIYAPYQTAVLEGVGRQFDTTAPLDQMYNQVIQQEINEQQNP